MLTRLASWNYSATEWENLLFLQYKGMSISSKTLLFLLMDFFTFINKPSLKETKTDWIALTVHFTSISHLKYKWKPVQEYRILFLNMW